MKISSPNLKNLDAKQIAVDHGEKIVVGLIGLFVLYALFGTRWMPYSRTPEELIALTDAARDDVEKRDWPPEERKQHAELEPVVSKARQMLEPVQATPYAYSVPMWRPLFPAKQKNGEPKWLPPEKPVAIAAFVPLYVPINQPGPEPTPGKSAAPTEDNSNIPAEFRKRADGGAKAGQPRRAGGGRIGFNILTSEDEEEMEADRKAAAKAGEEQRKRQRENRGRRNRKDDDDIIARRSAADAKTQGWRFASVRAVIPINRQYMMLAKAFHEPVISQLESTLTLLDFELQREKLLPDGTWSDWEPVDIAIAMEILAEAGGFDPEIVAPGVTDPTVTMPLPPRAMGQWGKDVASHKDIENFELTEEEIDLYVQLQEKVMAAKEEQEKNQPKPEKPDEALQPKGWNEIQWNERKVLKEMGKLDAAAKDVAAADTSNSKTRQAMIDDIKKKVSVDGQLILFRYFDFGVEPGNAYRYRVRVIYNNPNYNLGLDRVADPAYASGPVRPTDWSVPTEPVIIPGDSKLFLAGVTPAPAGKEPTALIDMFQWYAGTTINSVLQAKLGQFIGGRTKTPWLRPAEYTFEDSDVAFSSNEALVDMVENPKLNYEEHPDLGFTKPLRGGRIDITNQALVVDEYGEFAVLDPVSIAEELATAKERLGYERAPFQELYAQFQAEQKAEKERRAQESKGVLIDEDDEGGKRKGKKARPRNSSIKNQRPRGYR
ncbi:MAG: hypothetical protein WD648_14145 [Planctomycetaceae bacterium]